MNWIASASALTPATLALIAVMTFGAALVRGLTGFGMAIILVPLLSLVIRPDQAVVLAILLQFLIGPMGVGQVIADCHWPSARVIAGSAVFATPLGLLLLARTTPDVARLIITAIAIVAFVLVLLPRKQSVRPSGVATVATGLIAGVLTGFAAMPGPPVVPYYLRGDFTPHQARASMMMIFFATAIAGTFVSLVLGLATIQLGMIALILFVPMLAGNSIGAQAFGRISPIVWRSAVAGLLGVSAISAIVRAIW